MAYGLDEGTRDRLPRRSYWLPKEFHTWPEVRLAGLFAIGAFVSTGIHARRFNIDWIQEGGLQPHDAASAVQQLVKVGLWTPQEHPRGWGGKCWRTKPMDELRRGRGVRGPIILLSELVPMSTGMIEAGNAAFGVWLLAASWSLTTPTPGFIPTDVALTFGKPKHVEALWESEMWLVAEHGFIMGQGRLLRQCWDLARDDERVKLPKKVRDAVVARDGRQCRRCGATAGLAFDHIYPWSLGGPDTVENLQLLCGPCNSSKGARVEDAGL